MDTETKRVPVKRRNENGGSREKILRIALREFAAKGLSGARVDRIAALAKTSKRMLYYHFKNKEHLYRAVLDQAYAGIRAREADLDIERMDPIEALRAIVIRSFDYHCQSASFVRLVMNENIHHARHISTSMVEGNRTIIAILTRILERGAENGSFRRGIDPKHLHLTISGLGFHYVSNRYTFSHIFEMDMESPAAIAERREIAVDIVLRWCQEVP
jgi:AcrR family transcriptional regulator